MLFAAHAMNYPTVPHDRSAAAIDPAFDAESRRLAFYRSMLERLNAAGAPYLVGGTHALAHYTGIQRATKDFDIFCRRQDLPEVEGVLAAAGCRIEPFAPFWLSKAYAADGTFIDLIHSSGNGVADVDQAWLDHAAEGVVFGVPVRLCPAEETMWSKAFIMERERFDGADVLHIIHQRGERLDWRRLVDRFGEAHWRVLFAHLTLFGFVYPHRRAAIPDWVMADMLRRMRREQRQPPPRQAICRGTKLSRQQYLVDLEQWGYSDGRLVPEGRMTRADAELWELRRRADQGKQELH